MHLLAAQPGGFVDEEGIIDLQQDPADLVLLAAADSVLGALSEGAERLPEDFPELRIANWMHLTQPAAADLYFHKVVEQSKVVVLSLLGGASYWQYGLEQLQQLAQVRGFELIVVPGDDTPDAQLLAAGSVSSEVSYRVWRYLREGGPRNIDQLYRYIGAELFQRPEHWQEPRALPLALIYQSGQEQGSLAEWKRQWQPGQPVVGLLFYRSHLQSGNLELFDQLITLMQQQGLNPLPLAVTSLKEAECLDTLNQLIDSSDMQLLLNTTGFAVNARSPAQLAALPSESEALLARDICVLQLIISGSNRDDWEAQTQGLRSRDIAMQIALPEMDGRIISRAIGFKGLSHYSKRSQLDVIRYQLHDERARWVLELAARWCRLRHKPNGEKRIAIILANYPTKDGRIGNGVGLDTPDSAHHILQALQNAGYPVSAIPAGGDELIRELLGAVTNNPESLFHRPCWQSLALDQYRQFFGQLPEESKRAVLDRWGAPESDPKCRNGRLMLAGIRLGETFVGIQPARGFNIDLAANYHDPDLIPPHSYLAFYFWLRHCYQVEAVIHVGKHGNLEWLPGKGTALSEQCWPDIALGPMPHLYPFIVNDPGEGSQAKRRTQAVIIDHLMPPMTRAETYGALAELEQLVDEYYQAMGLDPRREALLRGQIMQLAQESHLLEELGVKDPDSEDEVLNQLDGYLCEIKEAQIRDGLHRLGKLPEGDSLRDTLIALIRLPRGEADSENGILHTLVKDLKLRCGDEENSLYDPFQADGEAWLGNRPDALLQVGDDLWRSRADTRERLELLAAALIEKHLLDETVIPICKLTWPATHALFDTVSSEIYPALQRSARNEINAVITGLQGGFIPAGPSGAPTRGRLDTLPTGRNFYSLDSRSIPSKGAWQLGQASAEQLIMRHLQEQGDYPKQIGLSVWGTATMRTGGDDIAQAFALMGIRPIWAPGSQRVVDFEIIPAFQLGRPRVDVTLRVSGFFRDAFPNVMKLYDSAVQALAELDEPGSSNLIRQHVEQRQAELEATGVSAEQARREASYRVFGSKPGAYGAGLQGLIDERCWENASDLADAYLNWGGFAYGQNLQGEVARDAFSHRLSQLEAVVQNQDNREHDLLDSDDYYQFQGGMANAVRVLKGETPEIYHSDHSNPSAPKIRTLKEELNRVIRSRVLNPKWINAMQRHGYKGAFEMAASVDYMFAYDATTDLIDDYQYQQVSDALLFEPQNREFLENHNPDALEEMAERMLEAMQRGLWQEPGEYQDKVSDLLLELDEGREGAG
ncbi:cobaltochelatase subunit CobN [Marinobacterium jannaschii]|uniref:cobaltochelatase subunit CobN n=1 Tax=Marinobacterium jannaschii TaxID=64970 RepID=UPI000489487A|nr:cobaltochelatase subunit CobN [Marinobacterium jannaschii]